MAGRFAGQLAAGVVDCAADRAWIIDVDHLAEELVRTKRLLARPVTPHGGRGPRPEGGIYQRELVCASRPPVGPPEAPDHLVRDLRRARYIGWQFRLYGAGGELMYTGRIKFADEAATPHDVDERALWAPLLEFGKPNGAASIAYWVDGAWRSMEDGTS